MSNHERNYLFSWIALIWPWITIFLIILNILISPWFSWYKNALSDLGVHQYGFIFNSAIFTEGIINGVYFFFHGKNSRQRYLIVIGSFSLSLVGVFNENFHLLHLIFALIYFIFMPIYIILNSGYTENLNKFFNIIIGTASLFVIIVGILSSFRLIPRILGLGVYEMLEAVLISMWISIYILREKIKMYQVHNKTSSP
jgi:Predicted membrane protein